MSTPLHKSSIQSLWEEVSKPGPIDLTGGGKGDEILIVLGKEGASKVVDSKWGFER